MRIAVYKAEFTGDANNEGATPIRGALIKEVRANSVGDWAVSFTLTSAHFNYINTTVEDGENALFWIEAHAANGTSHHSFVEVEKN